MATPNFELVTELQATIRRDFSVAEALVQPFSSNPIVDGEFLELDSSYRLVRGTGEGTSALVFPVHTERGRSDVQAISKVNVIFLGEYEADTTLVNTTGIVLGAALTVQDVTVGGVTKRGLAVEGATAGRVIVGYVSKIHGNGKVRFVHFGNKKA